jgi:hypothetical protein
VADLDRGATRLERHVVGGNRLVGGDHTARHIAFSEALLVTGLTSRELCLGAIERLEDGLDQMNASRQAELGDLVGAARAAVARMGDRGGAA